MNETGKRTAGPWTLYGDEVSKTLTIHAGDTANPIVHWMGFDYGDRPLTERKANAAFIVQACNAFPALVEALEAAEKADKIHSKCYECNEYGQAPEVCEHCFPSADDARVLRRNVLAAVKQARSALEAALKSEGR